MNGFKECTDNPMDNNPAWKGWEDNYNKYYLNYKGDKISKIPQIIHFIWLGSDFPEKYKRIKETWEENHPHWNIFIWNDIDAEEFGMINKEAYDAVSNIGAKSDIFRYEILYRHGGIYVDTDIECFKSFDDLLYLDFFAGTGWNAHPVVFNGLLACAPGNKFLRNIIQKLYEWVTLATDVGEIPVLNYSGCDFITPIYNKYIQETTDKTVIFPNHFFYPVPAVIRMDIREDNEVSRRIVNTYKKSNSYCVHLWYCSWH